MRGPLLGPRTNAASKTRRMQIMMQASTYLSSSVTYPERTRDYPRLPEIARGCPRLPRQRHVGNHWDGARDGHLVRGAGEHDRACVRKTPSRYGEIWGDVGRDGERWGDMGSPTLAAPALRAEYVLRAGPRHRAVYSEHRVSPRGYECS